MNTSPLTRHQKRRAQTRAGLIRAAVELVIEKGYDAVTVQDVTDRADFGRGTFYVHFKDKEDVVGSAIQNLLLDLEQQAHQQYKDRIPEKPEYFALRNIFKYAEENRDLFRVSFSERGSAALAGRVRDLMADMFLYDLEHNPAVRNPHPGVPPKIVALIMTAATTRMISWWLDAPNKYNADQMAGMLYEVLYHKRPPTMA